MSPNALTTEQVKVLLNLLEMIRQQPQIYVTSENLAESLHTFLSGIRIYAETLSGFDGFIFAKTALLRGWGMTPQAPYRVMQDEGLADEAIVEELLIIETETYKRIFNIESVDKLLTSHEEKQIASTILTTAQVKVLLNLIERFQQRRKFFINPQNNAEAANAFLMGIRIFARHLSGFDEWATFVETAARRGWPTKTPKNVLMIMREKGFSGEAIIDELISIEVETYKWIFDIE